MGREAPRRPRVREETMLDEELRLEIRDKRGGYGCLGTNLSSPPCIPISNTGRYREVPTVQCQARRWGPWRSKIRWSNGRLPASRWDSEFDRGKKNLGIEWTGEERHKPSWQLSIRYVGSKNAMRLEQWIFEGRPKYPTWPVRCLFCRVVRCEATHVERWTRRDWLGG